VGRENLAKLLYAQLLLIFAFNRFGIFRFGVKRTCRLIRFVILTYLNTILYGMKVDGFQSLRIIFPSSRIFLTNMTEVR